jgi:oleandomycin transport system permease protein
MVRYVISVAVTLGFGMVLGFRIATSPLDAVMGCILVLVFALAMCWVFAMLGMLVKTATGVQLWGFLFMFPLVFGSNILTETAKMPGWLQAFVKVNPVTYLTEAERALLTGLGQAEPNVVRSLLWALGIFVVFAPLAVAAYRRKA